MSSGTGVSNQDERVESGQHNTKAQSLFVLRSHCEAVRKTEMQRHLE